MVMTPELAWAKLSSIVGTVVVDSGGGTGLQIAHSLRMCVGGISPLHG
jgi:hypothetical protein